MISALASLPLAVLGLAASGADPDPAARARELDRIVQAELRVSAYELQSLAPRTRAGGVLELELALGGVRERVELVPHAVRAETFELRVQREHGAIERVEAPPPATYRGRIAGQAGSRAAAGLVGGGIKALVVAADGRAWYVQPLAQLVPGARADQHLVYAHDALVLDPAFCGAPLDGVASTPPAPRAGPLAGGACLKLAELAWDCDHETYLANGSSVPNTLADVEAVTNAVNVYYARDVLIEHVITTVIVRTAEPDPYASFDPGVLLDSFVNEWRTNHAGVQRDMAHLATGREMDGNIIGLAYVGVVCNLPWAFGLTQWNLGFGGHVSVVAHELGHNWGAGHCHDPCDIMCGGCPFFGPVTTGILLASRAAAGCLVDAPPFADELPPHVLPEMLDVDGEVVIDVLANDLDGNCDPLTIASFDAVSEQGASITRSVGSGPGGRDELRYTPAAGFEGLDRFTYTISDGTGNLVDGEVTITLYDGAPDIAAHYRFDELSGSVLVDASGHGLDGAFLGSPALGQPGVAPETATSVRFDGVFDRARVPNGSPLAGLRRELSVAAWVRPDIVVGENQIVGNGGAWALGIRDGAIVFTVHGVAEFTRPGTVPLGAWSHVAAVFDDDQDVTLYLDGESLGTVEGNAIAGWPGENWHVAGSGGTNALFGGRIDELQVYDHALLASEVRGLHDFPGLVIERCAPPVPYCQSAPNSFGPGAFITSLGTTNLWRNDFELVTYGCPPGQPGMYYYGPNAIELPFGNGFRCVGGAVHRFAPQVVDELGFAFLPIDYDDPPDSGGTIEAGSTWRFQFWYRDPAGGGASFNLSNGLAAVFCP